MGGGFSGEGASGDDEEKKRYLFMIV